MDWQGAIDTRKKELLAIAATLQALMAASVVSRQTRLYVLRILRPAESSLRRLIVVVASRMEIKPRKVVDRPAPDFSGFAKRDTKKRAPAFRLFDPQKRYPEFEPPERKVPKFEPRMSFFDAPPPLVASSRSSLQPSSPLAASSPLAPSSRGLSPGSSPGASLDSGDKPRNDDRGCGVPIMANTHIHRHPGASLDSGNECRNDDRVVRRLNALIHALNTLPHQARRLTRAMERHKKAPLKLLKVVPLRAGTPPGYRRKNRHDIDEILKQCHYLARDCRWQPP